MRSISTVSTIIILSVFISPATLAQHANTSQRFELAGSLGYTYDNESPNTPFYPPGFDYYDHRHFITIQPALAYFFTQEWQLQLSLNYNAVFTFQNAYNPAMPNDPYKHESWYHVLGFGIGPIYNYHLNESTILFGKFAGAISWVTGGYDSPPQSQRVPWSKPSFTFPIIAIGSKLFLSPDWMVLSYAQYSRTSNFSGFNNSTLQQITFGVGFAVLL